MREYKDIEGLLEKYYNGNTSLEEEQQLQTFFEGEGIPDHLMSHKDQFTLFGGLRQVKSTMTDEDLFSKIEVSESKETPVIKMKPLSLTWLYRVAAAVALVMVGYWVGNQVGSGSDMENIQGQLDEMKALMFTQLESSSASGRLQAVNNSMGMEEVDDETVDVLIALLKNEKNMHVRTKTVEALTKLSASKKVSKAFSDALLDETEPAVQLALIEGLVTLKQQGTVEVLKKLTEDSSVLKEVQDEAHLGIFKLKEL